MERAYSNAPDSKSENVNPPTLTLGQIAQALDELIALDLVEKFRDEFNVIRYRPANGRIV
jgi:hypothetical protein